MSNSRLFCLVLFLTLGLLASFSNHIHTLDDKTVISLSLLLPVMAVAFFGDRK